jgi:hypothetical protein
MRRLVLALAVTLCGCNAIADSWEISSAKAAVSKELGDPPGLQFRFVEVQRRNGGDSAVCGYATTLTASGSYDDVHRFFYSGGYATVSPDDRLDPSEYARRRESFEYFYGVFCEGKPSDPDEVKRILRP